MTDPLRSIRDQLDDARKRFVTAIDLIDNAIRFHDQAARLGFAPDVSANRSGFSIGVTFSADLTDAIAIGDDVPMAEVAEQPSVPVEAAPEMPKAAAPVVTKSKFSPGTPWTDEEIATARRMCADGATASEIAGTLGRRPQGAAQKIKALRRVWAEEAEPKAPAAEVTAPVEATPAPSPEPAADIDFGDDDDEADFWTPARDLHLAQLICRGFKIVDAADEVGCSDAEAKARWKKLCPRPSLSEQQRLLKRLHDEVAA